ncbi:unnamed protein product, partial [Symbiodinium microadriaticum]
MTYTVIGTGGVGCSNTDQIEIVVNPLPTVTASVSDAEICLGDEVVFTGGGAASYSWDNAVIDNVAFSPSGTATFTVTGTDINGCIATAQIDVTVNVVDQPTIEIVSDNGRQIVLSSSAASAYQWYESGEIMDGETGQTIQVERTYTFGGDYQVEVTEGECSNISDTEALRILNADELSTKLEIWPNPVYNVLNVKLSQEAVGKEIKIYDLTGSVVDTRTLNHFKEFELDLSTLGSGVYFLAIEDLGEMIRTDADDTQLTIPAFDGPTYDYSVYWENVDDATDFGSLAGQTGSATMTGLTGNSTYRVEISGTFPRIYFNNSGDREKILTIEQWGDIAWTAMNSAFYGCTNLTVPAVDAPDLTGVISLQQMFRDATSFNDPIDHWEVDNITGFFGVFWGATSFNQPLDNWNMDAATNLSHMFNSATSFNQPLDSWNTTGVTEIRLMFNGATAFNQSINHFDVSLVSDFAGTFENASSFNRPLDNWEMGGATTLGLMFSGASSFNQPIDNWDVSNVASMNYMFQNATNFDGDLGPWNIESIGTMTGMLNGCGMSITNYDKTLIGWATLDAGEAQIPVGVPFRAIGLSYCNGASARTTLDETYTWEISSGDSQNCSETLFVTTWQTDNSGTSNNDQIRMPITGSGFDVDWVEVGNATNNGSLSNQTGPLTITFPSAGTYRVLVDATSLDMRFEGGGDAQKILTIEQWGSIQWTWMYNAYGGCTNLTIPATDAPDLTLVTDARNMFENCSSFNEPIDHWDVGSITNMERMFRSATSFNQDLNSWDVRGVTNMNFMFNGATSFNGNISSWETESLGSMQSMFWSASAFNQPIGDWDVSGVGSFYNVFQSATSFNQPLDDWEVSGANTFSQMFWFATSFNQDLNSWQMSGATAMVSMFRSATAFNGDISSWNVSGVTSTGFNFMFQDATSFNGDISGWTFGTANSFNSMFRNATSFNQDLSGWGVSGIQNMSYMFSGADLFNQDISGWETGAVTNFSNMFSFNDAFNGDVSAWDVSSATSVNGMFSNATSFDQDLGGWDISLVTNMSSLLSGTNLSVANYDATLQGWASLDAGETQIPTVITLGANGLTYCQGADARSELVNTYGWAITDDGLACPDFPSELFTTEVSSTQIDLSWTDNSSNETAFAIFRSDGNNSGYTEIDDHAGGVADANGFDLTLGSEDNLVAYYQFDEGDIPSELGNLINATELDLMENQLSGAIPVELGNMSSLLVLELNENQLTGSIPGELGNLSSLVHLNLERNQLSGSIPAALGNLTNLDYLDLEENQLTGNIPTELGNLINLTELDLMENQLSGTIPVELGNMSSLGILELNENQLTGSIPSELGNLLALEYMSLERNQLTGSIPSTLGNLVNLTFLDLEENQLTGSIPAELGNLVLLTELDLMENQLSGSIPGELGSMSSLEILELNENQLTGSIPVELGAIPETYGQLTSLDRLNIGGNQLTILPDLTGATSLTFFNAADNNFEFDDIEPNVGIGGIVYSPQADLPGPGDLVLNEGEDLDITIAVGGSNNVYQWYLDGSPVSGQTSDNLLISPVTLADAGTYHLEVTNTLATSLTLSSESFTVTVNPALVDFGSSEQATDLSVTFAIENTGDADLNIGSITSSELEFTISGAPSTIGIGVTETFDIILTGATIGSFNADITINSDDSDEGAFTFPVTGEIVSQDLAVVANATDTEICEGEEITLTGSGADTYSWDNGVTDGVAFVPTATTTYTVTGTDGDGNMGTDQITITVHALPTVTATTTDSEICEGEEITLTGTGADTYAWDNGVTDGVSFAPTGTQTYTVTGTDANSCTNTDQVTITVNTLPTVTATTTANEICEGEEITLTGTGADTYAWDNGVTDGVSFTPT